MQSHIRKKLLAIISSNEMNEFEAKSFPDMYKRDVYNPRLVTPLQAAWINRAYKRIFKGIDDTGKSLFPDKLGAFELVKKGADYYLEINGVPIPEPIAKGWGQQLVQYMNQAHKSGALTRSVMSLVKSESAVSKTETEEDPF